MSVEDERLAAWLAALQGRAADREALLEALAANAELTSQLSGQRWVVMRRARQAGATWEQIGKALGMSRQSAWEHVRSRIPPAD